MANEYMTEALTAYYLNNGHQYRTLKAAVIFPKVPAGLSILGSAFIIQDVLRNPKKRTKSIYHRVMVGLSIHDILFSFFFWFLTSWPMPKGYFIFASGNLATCDATGFLATIGMYGAPLYNCSLATYYLWQLVYNWPENQIKAGEKWLHLVPWVAGIGCAVVGLAVDAYGPLMTYCWVRENAFPVGCDIDESSVECIRPYNGTDRYFMVGFCILYVLSMIFVATLMTMVYRKVRQIEHDLEKFNFRRYSLRTRMEKKKQNKSMRKRSRRVMIQGILYSVALLIVVLLPIFVTIAKISGNDDPRIEIAMGLLNPLQGFFNMLIYLMPAFRRMRKRREKKKKNQKNDKEKGYDKIVTSRLCYCWCLWSCPLRGDITKGQGSGERISITNPSKQESTSEKEEGAKGHTKQGECFFHPSNHEEDMEEEKQEITRDPTEIPKNRAPSGIEAVKEEGEIDWKPLVIDAHDNNDDGDESEEENDYFLS